MNENSTTISLSLVSHTNVGKTTLARTLLSRNIGVIRDEPHVTDSAEPFVLLETPEGDALTLWDTPGFGDSSRLAARLQESERPIGWFVSQVWDRLTDRPLWSSQQAIRNAREEADVVLYLVSAAENPEDAGYVEPEMRILQWIGKPIIVLVNQMGPPSGPANEAAEVERWREHLVYAPAVRQVLALDAFARCWVQEGALLTEVARLLPEEKRASFDRLHRAWQTQRREAFDASMQVLALRLARAALDKEKMAHGGFKGRLRDVGNALGVTRERDDSARQGAMRDLALRLDQDISQTTNRLIELHGLEGKAGQEVLTRLADHYSVTKQVNEGGAAVVGGLFTGALVGLKADVISGGFTLGGGMIAGGVLGALGAAGLARGYNMVRGTDTVTVTWTDEVMDRLVASSLLAYLAVAHYGRGRGEWAQSEHPAFWESTVRDVLVGQGGNFTSFWRRRANYTMESLTSAVQAELTLAAERVLIRLYPEAVTAAAIGTGNSRLSRDAPVDAQRLRAALDLKAEQHAERAAQSKWDGDDAPQAKRATADPGASPSAEPMAGPAVGAGAAGFAAGLSALPATEQTEQSGQVERVEDQTPLHQTPARSQEDQDGAKAVASTQGAPKRSNSAGRRRRRSRRDAPVLNDPRLPPNGAARSS